MDENVRQHVEEYCKKQGWSIDIPTIIETIVEAERVYREELYQYPYWYEYLYVVQLDDMLIGYIDAESTGEFSPREMGYEINKASIREMRAVEKTTTVYEPFDGGP